MMNLMVFEAVFLQLVVYELRCAGITVGITKHYLRIEPYRG